jgi:glycosyltransferase involved in cell wall biosynthesis
MKIVQIVPGPGGEFYCENCLRDTSLVKTMRRNGHDVLMVPMYLPLLTDDADPAAGTPVFYGAINTYLKEKMPLMRHAPRWLERILDSPGLLEWAAEKAGSTRAFGLEDMTISMLRGEDGNQARELDRLVEWLKAYSKPDIIHLSNSLLLGLASELRKQMRVPVVCSLQDEAGWIDSMNPDRVEDVWMAMTEKAHDVDAFISVSRYYADEMIKRLAIPREKMNVVHLGVDLEGYERAPLTFRPPTIGYLSRLTESLGLGFLVEAFTQIKSNPDLTHIRLRATGGQTADDNAFLAMIERRLKKARIERDVDFVPEFDRRARQRFMQTLSVMCVPSPQPSAFGMHMLEAMACGVPVVQPDIGAYPEIIELTGGGIIYDANDMDMLVDALTRLLSNSKYTAELGRQGRKVVFERFSLDVMAANLVGVYKAVVKGSAWWEK